MPIISDTCRVVVRQDEWNLGLIDVICGLPPYGFVNGLTRCLSHYNNEVNAGATDGVVIQQVPNPMRDEMVRRVSIALVPVEPDRNNAPAGFLEAVSRVVDQVILPLLNAGATYEVAPQAQPQAQPEPVVQAVVAEPEPEPEVVKPKAKKAGVSAGLKSVKKS